MTVGAQLVTVETIVLNIVDVVMGTPLETKVELAASEVAAAELSACEAESEV